MRIEGSKEFRVYPENDADGLPFNVMTPGLLRELQESYKRRMRESRSCSSGRSGRVIRHTPGLRDREGRDDGDAG